jgi:hypothetical protein
MTEDENRLKIEFLDEQGVTETILGPTHRELKEQHARGECHMDCSFCYNEATQGM